MSGDIKETEPKANKPKEPATADPSMEVLVWVTLQFSHIHSWPDAPEYGPLSNEPIAFLCNPHRHMFHVKIGVDVQNMNRQVEFFDFQAFVRQYIDAFLPKWSESSCEAMALDLAKDVGAGLGGYNKIVCTVSEDGENGATVTLTD